MVCYMEEEMLKRSHELISRRIGEESTVACRGERNANKASRGVDGWLKNVPLER